MTRFKRIGVTVKSNLDERDEAVCSVVDILKSTGADILLDGDRCKDLPSAKGSPLFAEEKNLDLLVVIGGDGTIFRAVRELKDFGIPILGVNRGGVGFLSEIDMSEAEKLIPKLLSGEGVIDERSVLKISALRDDKIVYEGFVLNEAVISQGSIARLLNLKTTVNDEDLTTFRSDGLIIATPTGSTAYSLAAGGPIVHPSLSAMILTPINSHSFNQKPIVIPGDYVVTAEVLTKENKFHDIEVSLTLDGQAYVSLQRRDIVHVQMATETVKFLRRKQDTFFGTLRSKLKWGDPL